MLESWQRGRKKKIIPSLIITILLLTTFVLPSVAAGESVTGQVRLAVQPGMSGIYKVGLPTVLNITISNQGKDIKGLLVMEPKENIKEQRKPDRPTRYQKQVELPANTVVKTSLTVPGDLVNEGVNLLLLVDGKPVAASPVQGAAVNGGLIALSLGEKPLQGGVTAWLDQTFGGRTAIKYFAPEYLPEDPLELGMADVIIVDNMSVDQLTKQQLGTLKDWVSLGGMLLISGGAGTAPGGPLADISPVLAQEQKVIDGNLGDVQVVKGPMNVTTGQLNKGEVMARVNGVIVVASRDFGQGRVVYCGIPLENLTSESAGIWPMVFGQKNGSNNFDVKMQTAQEKRYMNNDRLNHTATYLPQLETPSVPKVAAAWFIYVLVVGPGLYLILKRYDRRDWLWWIIPVCAVVTTGVVYFMSPAQRINAPISQTLALVEIMDKQRAEVNTTAAFVSPYGGNLNVQGPKGAIVWTNNYHGREKPPVIQFDQVDNPHISFPDVEYWSVRQARATALQKKLGYIGGNLMLDNGYIKGKVENHTEMDLRDCRILVGTRSIVLDKIPAGASVEVNQDLNKWPVSLGPNNLRDELVPPVTPGQTDIFVRERNMVDEAIGSKGNTGSDEPIFFGWSDNSLKMFNILSDQNNVIDYNLVLIKQNLHLDLPAGKAIELPPGMLIPRLVESSGGYDQNPMGYTLYEGKLTLAIDLDNPLRNRNFRVTALNFPALENKNLSMKIYDRQDNKWVDLPSAGSKIGTEELERYRSSMGEFRLQVEKTSGLGQPDKIILPAVWVEGAVKQ